MDSIDYNIGIPGYTPLGIDGSDGANGYSVHFSTLPLDDDSSEDIVKSCISSGKPLSNNEAVRQNGNTETYRISDIIIDSIGNFAKIDDISTGNFTIVGRIMQYLEEPEDEDDVYDSSFKNAPALVFDASINHVPPQNTYNYYSFELPFDDQQKDSIGNTIYRYKPNTNKSVYSSRYYANSSTGAFITENLPKCHHAKIIITFSTGLVLEKIISEISSRYIIDIDNRYYYGYGRGVTTSADSLYAPSHDASYGGPSDGSIWQRVKVVQYAGTASDASSYSEQEMQTICKDINHNVMNGQDIVKYSIVDARMEFYHKDGNVYNIKLQLN